MFHIVVCVKQVPDTTNIRIDPETGNLIRQGIPTILNPYDAHAMAAAAEWKRRLDGKITVLTMGPMAAVAALRECVELGADRAILLSARQFSGADTLATSYVLAEAIRHLHAADPVDAVFFGKQAIDGDTAQVGPGVASRLGFPLVTNVVRVRAIDSAGRTLSAERKTEGRNEVLQADLPAALTCEKDVAEIPYAALPDLVFSLTYEPEVWTSESPIAYDPAQIGLKGSPTVVYRTGTPEQHAPGEILDGARLGAEEAVRIALERIASSPAAAVLGGRP